MKECIDYIVTWLCYGRGNAAARVAYTDDETALAQYDVLVTPCGHLGKEIVLPNMDKPRVDNPSEGKYIIRTDIVYNTFFFVSRAEETINPQRDGHGRFAARYSLLGDGNRLLVPLLDEYARLLLKLLGEPMPPEEFSSICLTHDIDAITQYRHWRGALGGLLRGEWKEVWRALRDVNKDPLYTFPWLVEQDAHVPGAQTVYFVKHTHGKGYDYPQYCLRGREWLKLKKQLLHANARLGIHGSYYGFIPESKDCRLFRAHYLRCSIEQMQRLADAGYTDDYSMGFADRAGFRLLTCRPVRWINPLTMSLTGLTLHPLLIMDNTLSQSNYMHLTEDEAYALCERIIATVKVYNGELCLLWHNSSFTANSYHRTLYPDILYLLH